MAKNFVFKGSTYLGALLHQPLKFAVKNCVCQRVRNTMATFQPDTDRSIGIESIKKKENIDVTISDENVTSETSSSVTGLKRTHDCHDEDVPVTKQMCIKPDNGEELKVKRRKVAMLLSYSGQGYLGMQRNPNMKTIEEDLFLALLKAGYVQQEGFDRPQNVGFQRSARTDKGVSAAGQIVSLKIPVEDDTVEKINSYLPPQIRVMGLIRVTRGFNSKTSCSARTYSYMMPTYSFASAAEDIQEDYRISEAVLKEVTAILHLYKGSHNFHNFTSRKKPLDPSAVRYIIDTVCGPPFVKDGLEFVIITIKGQSFMLHQIRKMIGLVITIMRGYLSKESYEKVWNEEKMDIPIAPGVGLVLEEIHYDMYNRRYGNDGIHEPLIWENHRVAIQQFKEQFIYPTIIEAEKNEKSMLNWVTTLPYHSFGHEKLEDSAPQTQNIPDSLTVEYDHGKKVFTEENAASGKSECVLTEKQENLMTDVESEMKPMCNKNEVHTLQPLNGQQTDISTDAKS